MNRQGAPNGNITPSHPPKGPSGVSSNRPLVTDEMADRACLAFYAYLRGNERPLTRRDLGIQRQAWKYALKEALKGD